jgi:hypothetical protein
MLSSAPGVSRHGGSPSRPWTDVDPHGGRGSRGGGTVVEPSHDIRAWAGARVWSTRRGAELSVFRSLMGDPPDVQAVPRVAGCGTSCTLPTSGRRAGLLQSWCSGSRVGPSATGGGEPYFVLSREGADRGGRHQRRMPGGTVHWYAVRACPGRGRSGRARHAGPGGQPADRCRGHSRRGPDRRAGRSGRRG